MIDQMIAPLQRRIQMMLARAVIAGVNDAAQAQEHQLDLLAEETHDGVEHFQGYGISSVAPAGLEALVAFVGGLRSHGVVIGVADRKYRLKSLQSGEVALYDDQGQYVLLGRDRITIHTDKDVRIEADKVEVIASAAKVTADRVDLGASGGAGVARIGDTVSGGVITGGSTRVFAA